MEMDYLYRRPVESDTETPRECQILAMVSAIKGEAIPGDIYEAVLRSAERRKDVLKEAMDFVNKWADMGKGKENARMNMMTLAGAIIHSHGINGPIAAKSRLNNLGMYVQAYLLTDEMGPTE